ncbi:unnamed protein product [Haemonchus placei]|uniref:Calnexin n=1 Tax=Haemonchus placei TaxID=6290 RepID=A0A3P7UZC0_HAEPC|nr:unnamed protein product [Haemonchus placei]
MVWLFCFQENRFDTVFVPSAFVPPKLSSKPLFFDYFPTTDEIGKRWIPSTAKKEGVDSEIAKYNGKWEIGPSSEVSIEGDYGLIVRTKARHHAIAAKLDEPFSFADKPLVVQYEVRYEEGQECGGGYLKLLSVGAEKNLAAVQVRQNSVHYYVRCTACIQEYHAKQPSNIGSTYWDDHQTHLYTLVVKPDGKFSVSVDQKEIMSGNMLNDLQPSLQPPKQIADPTDKKPADWDDRAEIEDESAVKPDDWDESQPSEVVDENAVKPSDWLENEVCCSTNVLSFRYPFVGKWVRPKIANPAYRGVWAPRQIENPHFFEPKPFDGLATITAIGIELWTMSQNIIFDNILVCESEDLAAEIAKQTYTVRRAEDARLASSQGKGAGIVQGIVDAANERPWLWVVYVLCILIPIILIGVCCFGRKSNADYAAERKKTDAPEIDDEVPNLVDDEEDEKDLEEAEMEEVRIAPQS